MSSSESSIISSTEALRMVRDKGRLRGKKGSNINEETAEMIVAQIDALSHSMCVDCIFLKILAQDGNNARTRNITLRCDAGNSPTGLWSGHLPGDTSPECVDFTQKK